MPSNVMWNALMGQPSIGDQFQRGFQQGRQQGREMQLDTALRRASRGDPRGMEQLWAIRPDIAERMEAANDRRMDRKRTEGFRDARRDYMLGSLGISQPTAADPNKAASNALTGQPSPGQAPNALANALGGTPAPATTTNALMPSPASVGAPPGPTIPAGPAMVGERPAAAAPAGGAPAAPSGAMSIDAWRRMIEMDPEGAARFISDRADQISELHERSALLAIGINDQASLDLYRQRMRRLWTSQGLPFDEAEIPATYSPEAMEAFRLRGLELQEQFNQIREGRETDWRIRDGMADNAREDRGMDSLIQHRRDDIDVRREGIAAGERNNVRSTTTSRDNSIRSTGTSRDNNIRSTNTSRDNNIRSVQAQRRGRAEAVGPNGQRIVYRNGAWRDAQTGQPVQR